MIFEVLLLAVSLWIIYKVTRKPENLPPGTFGFPVVGCVTLEPFKYLEMCRKTFGEIFCVKLGSRLVVQISDFKTIKSAFADPALTGRPDLFSMKLLYCGENAGVAMSEGLPWINGRRFALRHLRDLGAFKTKMEKNIIEEVSDLLRHLEGFAGKPLKLDMCINIAVLNVIWRIVANRRYAADDKKMQQFMSNMNRVIELASGPMNLLDFYPGLKPVLPSFIRNKWMRIDEFTELTDNLHAFWRETINAHRETQNPEEPRDYIDLYLNEVDRQKDEPETTFRSDLVDLRMQLADLFAGGSETTASTIRWFCLLMAKYPEVQKRMQKELDAVVPPGASPSLEDKDKLSYFMAVLHEVNRFASLLFLGVPHSAMTDTKIGNYTIPKGTMLFSNIEAVHRDPRYWEKPAEFYPEHFLDEDGKFVLRNEGYCPFAVGRRSCLGENLAKMELFLFASNLLHHFGIQGAPGDPLVTEPRKAFLFNWVQPYEVVLTKRRSLA